MSSGIGARFARVSLVVACVLAVGLTSTQPVSAQQQSSDDKKNTASDTDKGDGKNKDKRPRRRRGLYVLKEGPCDVKKMPKNAVSRWTPAGEHIVHKVKYGQGLQQIALKYGFTGDTAYRVLYDANPQLDQLRLEHAGITIHIPTCQSRMYRRKLPKPPPEPEETSEPAEPTDSGSDDSAPGPKDDAPPVADDSIWDRLAECESGGNWAANTGNGYYGGIQFSLQTWQSVGGTGYPHEHSREEQIKRGKILQERSGWGQWPHCAAELGLI